MLFLVDIRARALVLTGEFAVLLIVVDENVLERVGRGGAVILFLLLCFMILFHKYPEDEEVQNSLRASCLFINCCRNLNILLLFA